MPVLIVAALPFASAAEPIPEFEASYTIRYGPLSGTMLLRLSHYENGYLYETALRPKGLATLFRRGVIYETSLLEVSGGSVRPLDYASTDTIAEPVRTTRYFFDRDRVIGVYKSQQIDVPMEAGGQNRISAHVALMMALSNGNDISGFSIFDRARWKHYEFEVIPDQLVRTVSGNFITVEVRYTSPDDDKGSSLYFAPSLSYLPVMIAYREDGKVRSRAQLSKFTIADPASPR